MGPFLSHKGSPLTVDMSITSSKIGMAQTPLWMPANTLKFLLFIFLLLREIESLRLPKAVTEMYGKLILEWAPIVKFVFGF